MKRYPRYSAAMPWIVLFIAAIAAIGFAAIVVSKYLE
jgi:hypothetical protein